MRSSIRLVLISGCVAFAAIAVSAQAPPAGAPQGGRAGGGGGSMQNLKVIPKTWTRQQVGALMQAFTKSIGAENCGHCHTLAPGQEALQPGQNPRYAYELDDKPEKDIARKMMQMTMRINGTDIAGIGDAAVPEKVSCFTCHQGQAKPAIAPPDGWGRGAFTLSEAGPTLPARGGAAGGGGRAGAPGGRGN